MKYLSYRHDHKPSLNLNSVLDFGWALGPIFDVFEADANYCIKSDTSGELVVETRTNILSLKKKR